MAAARMISAHDPLPAPIAEPCRLMVDCTASGELTEWFSAGVVRGMLTTGHKQCSNGEDPTLVLNLIAADRPRPYRRRSQGCFVVSIVEAPETPDEVLTTAYPLLVRSLSNLLVYLTRENGEPVAHFVTLEQGYYTVRERGDSAAFFREVYRRLEPLAASRLVIDNRFEADLPEALWGGNERTQALAEAGRRLDALGLLPAPFPIAELLDEREMKHVHRLFGIGGLSYGNLSVRENAESFWMTARGVNKASLGEIGRDMVLIRRYDRDLNAMLVSVPAGVEPKPASVDAIEHWTLYTRHPSIGAIIHVHAWMDGIASTQTNFPCGTYELAREVAELVDAEPEPGRAVVGLKNHGLTIAGTSLTDIFDRIEGRILPQVPME